MMNDSHALHADTRNFRPLRTIYKGCLYRLQFMINFSDTFSARKALVARCYCYPSHPPHFTFSRWVIFKTHHDVGIPTPTRYRDQVIKQAKHREITPLPYGALVIIFIRFVYRIFNQTKTIPEQVACDTEQQASQPLIQNSNDCGSSVPSRLGGFC